MLGEAEAEAEEVAEEVATLALTALRDLVLLRPAVRFPCLALVLRCSVAADGALRSKAIRLVANKIHPRPISGLAPEIEQFAVGTLDEVTARGARGEAVPPEEVSRHFELLFALCTKKPALLRELLAIYGKSPRAQQQCIYESIDVLAKRVGAQAPVFVELVRQVPAGSEDLLLRMLNVANEAAAALPEDLSAALKDQYARTKDVRFVLPALGSLPKAALLQMLPDLVAGLSAQQFQTALGLCFRPDRTQAGASLDGPLAPADLLYALHLIDPRTSAVPLGKVKDAITCCFKLPEVFDFRVTSAALVRLMEVRPFPLMLMRTVLQSQLLFLGPAARRRRRHELGSTSTCRWRTPLQRTGPERAAKSMVSSNLRRPRWTEPLSLSGRRRSTTSRTGTASTTGWRGGAGGQRPAALGAPRPKGDPPGPGGGCPRRA